MNNEIRLKPVVKWAGGKTNLLPTLRKMIPSTYNNYIEPFIGGGAMMLDLAPSKAIINDVNDELIALYKCLKDESLYIKMLEELDIHQKNHCEEYFYRIREYDRLEGFDLLSLPEKAARFIYLNKTCFNGLYRVNSKSQFNSPWNKEKVVKLYDKANMDMVHNYFLTNEIEIYNDDFEKIALMAKEGDFVFLDAPYDKLSPKTFTDYSKSGFTREDQMRVARCFKILSDRGVKVLATNHNTPFIRELYKDYCIQVVTVNRNINSKASNRKNCVEEIIIKNY